MFGETDYDPARSYPSVPLEEQLTALTAAVRAGKVRHVGVSNETAWGLTTLCSLSTWHARGPPRAHFGSACCTVAVLAA